MNGALRLTAAVLPALLGFLIGGGTSEAACGGAGEGPASGLHQSASESPLLASPILPEAVVALNAAPLRPGLQAAAGTPADCDPGILVGMQAASKASCRGVLVAAEILEKYLPFRESLTSP